MSFLRLAFAFSIRFSAYWFCMRASEFESANAELMNSNDRDIPIPTLSKFSDFMILLV